MKRIYASLGLAAIGAVGIQNAYGQSTDATRSWGVSASLRGFYDDNVNTASVKANQVDSFGFEVSPSLSFALPLEQTSIAASYTYAYKWYEKKINDRNDRDDNTHTFAAQLRHAFSDRLALSLQDSFVIGQEPDMLRVGNSALGTFERIPGNNIRNSGSIVFNAQITRPFGIEVGYANALFDYEDERYSVVNFFGNPVFVSTSRSGLLDRMEHAAHVDGRWQLQPETVGIIGYQFATVQFTQNQPIGVMSGTPNVLVYSRDLESYSHYVYVGLEHSFRRDLTGNIRAGVRYTDYYNSPDSETSLSPYFQGSLRWTYAKESYLDLGVSHDRSATDQFTVAGDSISHDADSTVAYLSLTHRIAPSLFGSVIGNFQYSSFNGGLYDQDSERYYGFGVNLEYRFNQHVSANVGYNYDKLDSDVVIPSRRDFDRNRVYIGATFAY
jgi:hypothetical protein